MKSASSAVLSSKAYIGMQRHRDGVCASEVAPPSSSIQRRVTVQHFLPVASAWDADPIIRPRHGRKIAHDHHEILCRRAFP